MIIQILILIFVIVCILGLPQNYQSNKIVIEGLENQISSESESNDLIDKANAIHNVQPIDTTNIQNHQDFSKYVLKSTLMPCNCDPALPCMKNYMLKTKCQPNTDLSKYMLKTKCIPGSGIDSSIWMKVSDCQNNRVTSEESRTVTPTQVSDLIVTEETSFPTDMYTPTVEETYLINTPTVQESYPTIEESYPTIEESYPTIEESYPTIENSDVIIEEEYMNNTSYSEVIVEEEFEEFKNYNRNINRFNNRTLSFALS
jgi:hypothetical protein